LPGEQRRMQIGGTEYPQTAILHQPVDHLPSSRCVERNTAHPWMSHQPQEFVDDPPSGVPRCLSVDQRLEHPCTRGVIGVARGNRVYQHVRVNQMHSQPPGSRSSRSYSASRSATSTNGGPMSKEGNR